MSKANTLVPPPEEEDDDLEYCIGYMPFERSGELSQIFVPIKSYYNYSIYPSEEECEKRLISHIAEMRIRSNAWFGTKDCCIVSIWQSPEGETTIPAEIHEKELAMDLEKNKEFIAG